MWKWGTNTDPYSGGPHGGAAACRPRRAPRDSGSGSDSNSGARHSISGAPHSISGASHGHTHCCPGAYSYTCAYCHARANRYPNCHAYTNPCAYSHAYAHTNTNTDAHTNTNTDACAHSYSHAHAGVSNHLQ